MTLVRRVRLEIKDKTVLLSKGRRVILDRRVLQAQVSRDKKVRLVPVLKDRKVSKVFQLKDRKDRKVRLVQQVMMD